MIRLAIVLALLLSAAVMMRGLAGDWLKNLSTPVEDSAKKATPTGEVAAVAPMPQAKTLQPQVPGVLPDLKVGYLFNPERMLVGADMPPAEEGTEDAANDNTLGITASIDEVIYTGSIIADAFSRAIIVYPTARKAAQPASQFAKKRLPMASGAEEHARLTVGDVLDGYEVAEILPDKLIFTKGDETVEKLLYDPDKKRKAAAPSRPAAGPMMGGGGPPRPQQMTIGGEGDMAPTGAQMPGRRPTPTEPAGRVSPSASPTPGGMAPGRSGAAGTSPPPPVRRMVISRQPSPGPDTSRVIRQSQGGEEGPIPLPPGVEPE